MIIYENVRCCRCRLGEGSRVSGMAEDSASAEWEHDSESSESIPNTVYAFEQQITSLWLFEKHRRLNFPSILSARLLSFAYLIMCCVIDVPRASMLVFVSVKPCRVKGDRKGSELSISNGQTKDE